MSKAFINGNQQKLKVVKHKVWPVSYIDDEGKQVDTLYSFDPSRVDDTYWVGEAFVIEFAHPEALPDTATQARIEKYKKAIAALEGKTDEA